MNDQLDMIQQKRLGYLILDGDEVPIITERLRNVPLNDWRGSELGVELKAQIELLRQRAQQYGQRAAETEWLAAVTAPLAEKYNAPDATMGELVKLLPEPDRTRAEAIVHAKVPDEALPLERVNRQPWHGNIENAIFADHKGAVSMDDILADAGIKKNSIERPAATAYAQRIMDVLTTYPANVPVPHVMPQQSDRPQ